MIDDRRESSETLIDAILHQHPRLSGDLFQIDRHVWAIHGYIPVDGEVILAEFDHPDTARTVLNQLAAADDRAFEGLGGPQISAP